MSLADSIRHHHQNGSETRRRTFPRWVFRLLRTRNCRINLAGKRKGKTMNPLIQLKTTPPVLITLALLCFALSPTMQAVTPLPDGGYGGGNTAEGTDALFRIC
jgi:hypothetical protein